MTHILLELKIMTKDELGKNSSETLRRHLNKLGYE